MVTANKKISGKLNVEMFDDVPVLRRKWQAALRRGEKLPRYEDVMLGSLGKLADHIVLLKNRDDALEVSRTAPLHPEMAARRSLGQSLERFAAPLRDRTRRGRFQRALQQSALSCRRALRAQRHGSHL
jgi:hypothetical protein